MTPCSERHRDWLRRACDDRRRRCLRHARSGRMKSHLLPGRRETALGRHLHAGDARAEPQKAAPAIANARCGAGRRSHACAVRGIETSGGARRRRHRTGDDSLRWVSVAEQGRAISAATWASSCRNCSTRPGCRVRAAACLGPMRAAHQ